MKDYMGFIKNYNIKIPNIDYFNYYIETLSKSKEYSDIYSKVEDWENYENMVENVKKDKQELLVALVKKIKSLIGDSVRDNAMSKKITLSKINFVPDNNKFYISIDIKQGNWSVIRDSIEDEIGTWEEYLKGLDYPKPIIESKGFRQAVLGQANNPKNYTTILKSFTQDNLELLKKSNIENIVGINDEEIHIDMGYEIDQGLLEKINNIEWLLSVKIKVFKSEFTESFGKYVRLDHYYEDSEFDNTRMYGNGGDGNKFYINFKNLILKEEIDVKDTIVKKDKLYFQYCGNNYDEMTEYNYIKRWLKPLVRTGDIFSDESGDVIFIIDNDGINYIKDFDIYFPFNDIVYSDKQIDDIVQSMYVDVISKKFEIN